MTGERRVMMQVEREGGGAVSDTRTFHMHCPCSMCEERVVMRSVMEEAVTKARSDVCVWDQDLRPGHVARQSGSPGS